MFETPVELQWMILFILSYSITTVNKSQKASLIYLNNLIYAFSGLLLTMFIFKTSAMVAYTEYQWVVGFLLALTFKDVLPVLMEFTTDVINEKLKTVKDKIIGT